MISKEDNYLTMCCYIQHVVMHNVIRCWATCTCKYLHTSLIHICTLHMEFHINFVGFMWCDSCPPVHSLQMTLPPSRARRRKWRGMNTVGMTASRQ